VINEEECIEDVELPRPCLVGEAPGVAAIELIDEASAQRDGRAALLHHDGHGAGRVHEFGGKVSSEKYR